MKQDILKLMKSVKYEPMNKNDLARTLKIPVNKRGLLRKTLQEMRSEGILVIGKKARYSLRSGGQGLLVGEVRFLKKGGAFFLPDFEDEMNLDSGIDVKALGKIFIPSKNRNVALDGDRVVIQLSKRARPKWHKYSRKHRNRIKEKQDEDEIIGKIVKIIERKKDTFIGLFIKRGGFHYIQPEDPLLPVSMDVTETLDAKPGQVVLVKLLEWRNYWDTPLCEVVEVVGWPEDPGVDILSVIHEFRLAQEFSKEALKQAEIAHAEGVCPAEVKRRIDWRERIVITIDPADAKDFDDAISVKKQASGWSLAVHIADVSHYVKPNTELDREALERGNSTYLVDRVLPMLPELLCNDICSLRPNVDRLTKCATLEVGDDGEIRNWALEDAVICSKRKFSYEEAMKVLEREPEGEIEEMIHEAWKMAQVLRSRRFEQGALDLEFPEIKVVLDNEYIPQRVERLIHDASHQLIEECMLVANEAVAKLLKGSDTPSIYRIHEEPDFDKLLEFTELARAHGFQPGDLSNKKHIQQLLETLKGDPSEQSVKIGFLKSLKRAAYSTEPLGHYGLGKTDYCHFTSPIRRYADLIVHRGVQALLKNPPQQASRLPKKKVLEEQANHISTTERNSAAAESKTKKMKLMEYLFNVFRKDGDREFDGIITECRKNGAFVEITDIFERGLVKIEEFPRGNWRLDHGMHRYLASGGRVIRLGQKVTMKLSKVDVERQLIDLRIIKYE